jgi:hypothetical protein
MKAPSRYFLGSTEEKYRKASAKVVDVLPGFEPRTSCFTATLACCVCILYADKEIASSLAHSVA